MVDATSEMLEQVSCSGNQGEDASSSELGQVTPQLSTEKKTLKERLVAFRQTLHGSGRTCVGSVSLCTGFSMDVLEEVVENANDYKSVDDIYTKLPLFSTAHAISIFKILEDIQ